MRSEPARFLLISGAEKFNHCAGSIHSARCVYSWPDAKAYIVGSQACAFPTSGHVHQSPQARISGAWQILQTKSDNRSIFTG
jgi:hypothetical protein